MTNGSGLARRPNLAGGLGLTAVPLLWGSREVRAANHACMLLSFERPAFAASRSDRPRSGGHASDTDRPVSLPSATLENCTVATATAFDKRGRNG